MGKKEMHNGEHVSGKLHFRVLIHGSLKLGVFTLCVLILMSLSGLFLPACGQDDNPSSSTDDDISNGDDSTPDDDDDGAIDDTSDDSSDDTSDDVGGDGFHAGIPPYSGWAASWDNLLRFDQESAEILPYPGDVSRFISISAFANTAMATTQALDWENDPNTLRLWSGAEWETVPLPNAQCDPWSVGLPDASTVLIGCRISDETGRSVRAADDDLAEDFHFELWRGENGVWELIVQALGGHNARVECHAGSCLWMAEENYFVAASGLVPIGPGFSPVHDENCAFANLAMGSVSLGVLRYYPCGDDVIGRIAYLYDGAYTQLTDQVEGLDHTLDGVFSVYVLDEETVAAADDNNACTYVYSAAGGWRQKPHWPSAMRSDFTPGEAVFAMTADSLWVRYEGLWLRRPDVDFTVQTGEDSLAFAVAFQ